MIAPYDLPKARLSFRKWLNGPRMIKVPAHGLGTTCLCGAKTVTSSTSATGCYGPVTTRCIRRKPLKPKVFIYIYMTMLQINKYISTYPHTYTHTHRDIYLSGESRISVTALFLLNYMSYRDDTCNGNRRKNHNRSPFQAQKCKKSARGGLFT
jgi:hypothetical protein